MAAVFLWAVTAHRNICAGYLIYGTEIAALSMRVTDDSMTAANGARLTEQQPGIAMTDPTLFPYIDTAMRVIAVLALCALPILVPMPERFTHAAKNLFKRRPARVLSGSATK